MAIWVECKIYSWYYIFIFHHFICIPLIHHFIFIISIYLPSLVFKLFKFSSRVVALLYLAELVGLTSSFLFWPDLLFSPSSFLVKKSIYVLLGQVQICELITSERRFTQFMKPLPDGRGSVSIVNKNIFSSFYFHKY